ncbi:uncharacterized protein METZ01_LOCUS221722 [marine metagenome]|uniref:Uncharacterized protein n=1 Tax=marine metagenome TaxID=408172 RepID=A0A382G0P7_9ZZZZ
MINANTILVMKLMRVFSLIVYFVSALCILFRVLVIISDFLMD